MIHELWTVYQQGMIGRASDTADTAKRDSRHTDARLHAETQRLESKIDGLALICQALFEILRDKGGISEAEVEAKIAEIDLRDGRADGRIQGRPTKCPACDRTAHTRQRVCMYCGEPVLGGMLVEKSLTARAARTRNKPPGK